MLINQNSVKKNRSNYRTIEVKTMFPESIEQFSYDE